MFGAHLSLAQRLYFRDELRRARATTLLDAEAVRDLVVSIERLGRYISKPGAHFKEQGVALVAVALGGQWGSRSSCGDYERELVGLFDSVRVGRNSAVHEGARARHFARHCVELALALESGLMAGEDKISSFMVSSPVCAEPWHPVSYARHQMLVNSFSFLPIKWEDEWRVLSDRSIARAFGAPNPRPRDTSETIERLLHQGRIALESAHCVRPDASVSDVIDSADDVILVVNDGGALLGIATFFDLL